MQLFLHFLAALVSVEILQLLPTLWLTIFSATVRHPVPENLLLSLNSESRKEHVTPLLFIFPFSNPYWDQSTIGNFLKYSETLQF